VARGPISTAVKSGFYPDNSYMSFGRELEWDAGTVSLRVLQSTISDLDTASIGVREYIGVSPDGSRDGWQ
jgi:hypothetical protein